MCDAAATTSVPPASTFEAAVEALMQGDLEMLQTLIEQNPTLVHARSARPHHSTLLHYVSANGVEGERQVTPSNILQIAQLLINHGADVNAVSEAYGGGSTTLVLTATSVHPERAGVQIELLDLLLRAGADTGGTSTLHACIANGQPGAAAFLISRGAKLDFVTAAALGHLDVLESLRSADAPSKQAMVSAAQYAAAYGQIAVISFLLENGFDPLDTAADGRTVLHAAAWGAYPQIVRLLISHGANPNAKDERYGATPLDVLLDAWSGADLAKRDRCCGTAEALVAGGARWTDEDTHPDPCIERVLSRAR